MKIEPMQPEKPIIDDPFYSLAHVPDNSAEPLSNEAMDKLIYET
jgi:hypothetical protein